MSAEVKSKKSKECVDALIAEAVKDAKQETRDVCREEFFERLTQVRDEYAS